MSGPPRWDIRRRSLELRGLWNPDGITRKARARYCKKCGAPVIAGMDDDRSAMATFLDPEPPLNALGEAIALLAGRATYSLRLVGGRYEIDFRDSFRITGSPAGTNERMEILVLHTCISFHVPDNAIAQHIARPPSSFGDDLAEPPF